MANISQDRSRKKQSLALVALAAALVIGVFIYICSNWSDRQANDKSATKSEAPLQLMLAAEKAKDNQNIQSAQPITGVKYVKLTPQQPTISDSIHAEATVISAAKESVRLEYRWKINDRYINDIDGNTLFPGKTKKKDRVSVEVTPYEGGVKGRSLESMFVVVHGSIPTLELEATSKKIGSSAVELQLVSSSADGDKILFSLEKPFLDGMSINKETGLVSWKLSISVPGVYKFGASATDADGNKAIKIFDININR